MGRERTPSTIPTDGLWDRRLPYLRAAVQPFGQRPNSHRPRNQLINPTDLAPEMDHPATRYVDEVPAPSVIALNALLWQKPSMDSLWE